MFNVSIRLKNWMKRGAAALLVSMLLWSGLAAAQTSALSASSASLSPNAVRNAYLLIKLKDYLSRANLSYASLQVKLDDARAEIEENREKISTLEDDIRQLETLHQASQNKVHNVKKQIAEKERDLGEALEILEFNEVQRSHYQRGLSLYLRLLYFQQNIYFGPSLQANGLKLFLREETLSKTLQRGTYVKLLERQTSKTIETLSDLAESTKKNQRELTLKRNQLAELRDQLAGEERNLEAQLIGKQNLLEQIKSSDEIYRELYASYKLAQQAILDEINLFETNIGVLDERIALFATQLTSEERSQINLIRGEADLDFAISDAAQFLKLSWPVSPKLGLTAFFDDPGYAARFGAQHHALDIRLPHGSVIQAPADGVIYRVHDASQLEDPKARLGYSYMILAHRKGVMTLYGHISLALRKEGEFVHRGDVLGLSGGTPGTPGAGGRTTGAHLHFEVFQDGVRVDPMEYLPLEAIPEEHWGNIPEADLALIQQQLQQGLIEAGLSAGEVDALQEWDTRNFEAEFEETLQWSVPTPEEESNEEEVEADEDLFWSRGS